MRRVPVSMVTPDMVLGKDIWGDNGLLLAKGIDHLEIYREKLILNGVATVYVNDGLSEDIVCEDSVCDDTRVKCAHTLTRTMDVAYKTGRVDMSGIDQTISLLIGELFDNSKVLVSLSDISASSEVTFQHSIDTTIYALCIANIFGLNMEQIKLIGEGTMLHDIGKIALDPDILYKTGTLTDGERKHVQCHAMWGYKILKEDKWMSSQARAIALLHHERIDGSGYPYGLRGDEIHMFPRIVAVGDVYDALTSERCYKPAMSNAQAIDILKSEADNGKLDKRIVDRFVHRLAVYPNGILVLLNNGVPAIVKSQNIGEPYNPQIRIIGFKNQGAYIVRDLDLSAQNDLEIAKANVRMEDLNSEIRKQFLR